MVIDESKKFVLTNYRNVTKTGKAVDTDHFTKYLDLDIKVEPEKPERVEIFNFRDEESKTKFLKSTSETEDFTNCFQTENPLLNQIENWQQVLQMYVSQSFEKIRIRKKNSKPLKNPLKG